MERDQPLPSTSKSDYNIPVFNEPENEFHNETSLLSGNAKPASTDELKSMLKEAGTELTIKYITGSMSFEDFYAELEKRKPKPKQNVPRDPQPSQPIPEFLKHPNVPHFDELMKDFGEGEEDGSNDEEENPLVDNEEANEDVAMHLDKNDEEWVPDKYEKGDLKTSKGKKKSKKEEELLQPVQKKKKKRRGIYEIPKHLSRQHGLAMLLRAQGKYEESIEMLFDIIEKAPNASAPFRTLGSIHEEKGDMESALKFYMVSANLRKSDISEWFDLIEKWVQLKNEKMVMMCFTKALGYARTREDKLDALVQRCSYLEEFRHSQKTILQCKGMILNYMDRSKPEEMLEFGRTLTKNYLDLDEVNEATNTMQNYFSHLPNHIDSEDVHSLVELLMSQQNYINSLEVIFKHCGVDVEMNHEPVEASKVEQILQESLQTKGSIPAITKVTVPSLMPIDLRCKTMQCLISAKVIESIDTLRDLLTDLQESDVEEYGDVYYDIAETMVEFGHHEEARALLLKLTGSQAYSKPAIWLTYGQCLNSLRKTEEAAKAYSQVLEMVPGHYEARVTLSSLEQQMGHHEKALELLSKDISNEGAANNDQLLLLHRCQLLYSQSKIDDFIIAVRQLMSFNFRGQFTPEFMKALMSTRTRKHRAKIFQLLKSPKDAKQESEPTEDHSQMSAQEGFRKDVWDMYLKLCEEMNKQDRLEELLDISVLAISCPTFCFKHTNMTLEAEFLCLKICLSSRKRSLVYGALKLFLAKEMDNNQAWNLYCYINTIFKNMIDLRFAMRALMKDLDNRALGMLNGCARLMSGTYIQAFGEFLAVYRQDPENDLALLCCALSLAHLSTQSFAEKRNSLIPQVMCLMNAYKDARGENQETYYNFGRVMQQLNVPFAAVHYYKKALEFPPILDDELRFWTLSEKTVLIETKGLNEIPHRNRMKVRMNGTSAWRAP